MPPGKYPRTIRVMVSDDTFDALVADAAGRPLAAHVRAVLDAHVGQTDTDTSTALLPGYQPTPAEWSAMLTWVKSSETPGRPRGDVREPEYRAEVWAWALASGFQP